MGIGVVSTAAWEIGVAYEGLSFYYDDVIIEKIEQRRYNIIHDNNPMRGTYNPTTGLIDY